jgi:ATP-dependent DNA ligase
MTVYIRKPRRTDRARRAPTVPTGFIPPCLPTTAANPPSGPLWLHEIKHDGFRVIARKDGDRLRLYSRPGNDLTDRFARIVEAMARLRARSCIIDGEAVACDDGGMPSFDRRCRPIWGTKTSSIRCGTPRWRRPASRNSGTIEPHL